MDDLVNVIDCRFGKNNIIFNKLDGVIPRVTTKTEDLPITLNALDNSNVERSNVNYQSVKSL